MLIKRIPSPPAMSGCLAIFIFLLLYFPALGKAKQEATITVGSVITADKSSESAAWFSPSRRFAFGFYAVGTEFAVGVWFVPNFTAIWTANRDGGLLPEKTKLNLTEDGLQIPNPNGDRVIANISTNEAKLASASMLDSGNFVIQDVNNNIIWQTFDSPTDTLMVGQRLGIGKRLTSSVSASDHSSGRFEVVMQEDGSLVACPVNTPSTLAHAYWSLNTDGDGYTSIVLKDDCALWPVTNLNGTSKDVRASSSTCFARIEPDGFLRVYNISSRSIQLKQELPNGDSGVGKCIIKGACGPNSYCNFFTAGLKNLTGFDQGEAGCICFPGFDYIDRSKPYMGCQTNFSMGQCVTANNLYTINKLANIFWSDDPYDFFDNSTENDCSDSCFQDCNCNAALFADKRCSKQRLPLLYGIRAVSNPTVAFLKVGSVEILLPPGTPPEVVVDRVPRNITLFLSMALASFLALAATIVFVYKNRGPSYQKLCRNMETGLAGGMAPRSFTHQQLRVATDGFIKPLGKGNFSTVFKGEIPLNNGDVMPIAVKRLEKMPKMNETGFRTEMRAVGRAHHRNVVRLLGFCHEGPKWLLIYEYMSRGSLADLIFPSHEDPAMVDRLNWKNRTGIAMDVARGILYLHEGCESTIIHSDIKPENVLVDKNGMAKIGDLGLAKLLMRRKSDTFTYPRGTPWYKAPEWASDASEPVSPKVDVYSFGVLLLELITCRKYFLFEAIDECLLSTFAYKCLMESTLERLVPVGEDVDKEEMKKMVMIALWCVQKEPRQRKTMKEVVRMLGGKTNIPMPPDSVL